MLSNNLLIPYGFVGSLENTCKKKITNESWTQGRSLFFSLIILSYFIYRFLFWTIR
jgi:hypothetical protein